MDDLNTLLAAFKTQQNTLMATAPTHINFDDIIDSLDIALDQHINGYQPAFFAQQLNKTDKNTAIQSQKIVILQCVLNNWQMIFNSNYPAMVVEQYKKTVERILATCITEAGWSNDLDDVYWKDLAMARRLLYPAGAQIVESNSGYGLSQGITLNLPSTLRFLLFSLKQSGCRGYYQIHTHTPELSEFTPEGWDQCYLRIAQMLEINPHIKGIVGSSWFYDPALASVSPRLMYLQNVPRHNGASLFVVGKDHSGNAINKSKTRLALYEQGKYVPYAYLLVWPRQAMLNWANTFNNK